MDLEKIIQAVNYILQKYDFSLNNYTKMLKLIYIAPTESVWIDGILQFPKIILPQ
jgi:hypothetical protein